MRSRTFMQSAVMTSLLLLASCGGDNGDDESGLYLRLNNPPPDVSSVAYEIDCTSGESFSGHFEVLADRDPPIWQAFIGLSEGECGITLIAEDAEGEPICTGSTTVTVVAGQTVKANITLQCFVDGEDGRGNIDIDGSFRDVVVNQCPIIHFIGAIPSTIAEGSSQSDIEVRVSDRDGAPEPVTWTISASQGSIEDPNAADTVFTCPSVGGGEVEISVTATDGDSNCNVSRAITVVCPGAEDLCDGKDCSDGNDCTADLCAPADGSCSNPSLDDGTACGGGTCQAGVCEPSDLCEGKDCSDGNECTRDSCAAATGACSNPPEAAGTSCTAGGGGPGECDGAGACIATGCTGNAECETPNPCTTSTCNIPTGACTPARPANEGGFCESDTGICNNGSCNVGGCTNPDDIAIIDDPGFRQVITNCGFAAFGGGPPVDQCLQNTLGMSVDCSGCWQGFFSCTVANCAGQCAADPSSAACVTCLQTNCQASTEACTGLPVPL